MILDYNFIKDIKKIPVIGDKIEVVPEDYALVLRTNVRNNVYRLTPKNSNIGEIESFFLDCLADDVKLMLDGADNSEITSFYNIETRLEQFEMWLPKDVTLESDYQKRVTIRDTETEIYTYINDLHEYTLQHILKETTLSFLLKYSISKKWIELYTKI